MNKTTTNLKLTARAVMMLALCAGALSCTKEKTKNTDKNKTTPTVTVTGSYQLYTGEELSTLTLAGTAADGDKAVEGTLAWKDGATTYKEAGEQEAGWVFTPKDSGTYQNAEGTVKVTVKPNIYVAGETGGVGKVWKNGEVLYSFDDTEWSEATSITVYEGDIYVAGTESDKAKIWKNGKVLYELPSDTGSSRPFEIVVSGNDVYTAGCTISPNKAVIWKNDEVLYRLSDVNESAAFSVSISGNDVYAAGFGPYGTGNLWKNGNVLYQSEGEYSNVIVSGNDVYYSGCKGKYPNRIGAVWKNGEELYSFGDGKTETYAGQIILSGGDIYVPVGNKIYRNDKVLYTLKGDDGLSRIFIKDSDLYAINSEKPAQGENLGQVWKNGELLYTIGDGNRYISLYSIFVE